MDTKNHRVDDLFRKGLADLEISPTASGRSSFMKKARAEIKKRSVRVFWLPGSVVILLIALLGGAYLVNKKATKNQTAQITGRQTTDIRPSHMTTTAMMTRPIRKSVPAQNPGISANKKTRLPENDNNLKVRNNRTFHLTTSSNQKENKDQKREISSIKSGQETTSISRPEPSVVISTRQESLPKEPSLNHESGSTFLPDRPAKDSLQTISSAALPGTRRTVKDTNAVAAEIPQAKSPEHSNERSVQDKKWNIRAGIYYMPEWIFNTLDKNKYINNFGAEGVFRFGRYSLRTGIGLSVTRGSNEIAIDTKPYLGSYHSLDSITYHWDSRHYYLVPKVYTTLKDVFDTALHKNYFTMEREYTYLQIPLILGYDFYDKNWFSLGMRFGPVLSLLIKTRELTSAYDAGKDLILTVNNITPDRIHLNWQAMAGINASFHLSRRFIFELEPNLRYYFDSVYEKSGTSDKPWSIGIRASIMVNL
jgi:hypothetical protein